MSRFRVTLLIGLAVFVSFVAFHGVRPWRWAGTLATPAGVPKQTAHYECGPPWGSGYVHAPPSTAYPVQGTPCSQRSTYQLVTAGDAVLGVGVMVLVAGWGWRRSIRLRPARAVDGAR